MSGEERRFLKEVRPWFRFEVKGDFRRVQIYLDGKPIASARDAGRVYYVEPGQHLLTFNTTIALPREPPKHKSFAARRDFHWGIGLDVAIERPERKRTETSESSRVFGSGRSAKNYAGRRGINVQDRTGGKPGPVVLKTYRTYTVIDKSKHILASSNTALVQAMAEPPKGPISKEMQRQVSSTISGAGKFILHGGSKRDDGSVSRAAAILRALKTEEALELLYKASVSKSDKLRRLVEPHHATALKDLAAVAHDPKQPTDVRKRSIQLMGEFALHPSQFDSVVTRLARDARVSDVVPAGARAFFSRRLLPGLEHYLARDPRKCRVTLRSVGHYLPFLSPREKTPLRAFLANAAKAKDTALAKQAVQLAQQLGADRRHYAPAAGGARSYSHFLPVVRRRLPVATAGLGVGDLIIHFDGRPLPTTDLPAALAATGHVARLTLLRAGREVIVFVR